MLRNTSNSPNNISIDNALGRFAINNYKVSTHNLPSALSPSNKVNTSPGNIISRNEPSLDVNNNHSKNSHFT